MITLASTSLLLAGIAAAAPPAPTWRTGQAVKTTSGTVVGHSSTWMPGVSEYLGIPYALPPTGDLRFAAPKKYTGNSTLGAHKFSPDCPANVQSPPGSKITYSSVAVTVGGILGQAGDTFSEDCLTVNVWAKPQTGEKAKAVMIWIYGGGFSTGNSQSPAYNGARLAHDEDVVVVSVNYRINIFGFPKARFLPDLNPGLLDQRLAVEWVRDNIAAFGGDPKRIILFGQSAGGASVDMYNFAWTKDPIAYGFIPMSGSVSIGPSRSNSSSSWYGVSNALGCGGEEAGEKTLPCMRTKPFQDILKAMKSSGQTGMGSFGPTADGKVVFADYPERLASGNFIKAPILVGNTDDEGGLSAALATLGKSSAPKVTKRQATPAPNLSSIGCGPHAAALGRAKHGIPAWRYVYNAVFPNQDIGSKGAWHGADIGIVFGTQEFLSHEPDTEEEKVLVSTMMKAWASFAKDPQGGLTKELKWPTYEATKPSVISLGARGSAKINFVERKALDANCK